VFSTWYGVIVHSGYNLPPFDWIQHCQFLGFIVTPQDHQAHHADGRKNLGAITKIWDSLFGFMIARCSCCFGYAQAPELPATKRRLGTVCKIPNLRDVGDDEVKEIIRMVRMHGMIVVEGQTWSQDEQAQFTARLGEHITTIVGQAPDYFESHSQVVRLSNFRADGTWKGSEHQNAEVWHQDGDFMRMSDRHILTVLTAESVPRQGGDTGFVDLIAAAAALPGHLQLKAAGLLCRSSAREAAAYLKRNFSDEDARRFPDQVMPVVHPHPRDGRQTLLMGSELSVFEDQKLHQPDAHTTRLLFDHVLSPQWTYLHQYKPGDVIIWDNLQTLHRALPYLNDGSECRLLWRSQAKVTPAFNW